MSRWRELDETDAVRLPKSVIAPPPLEALPKFRVVIGFLEKEEFDITWSDWIMVSEVKRTSCWTRLCTMFIFPEGTKVLAKGYVMKQLAISFRGYRHDMKKSGCRRSRT